MKQNRLLPRLLQPSTRTLFIVAAALLWCTGTLTIFAQASPSTCSANPASRELDYWLGEWAVTRPGGPATGTSTVSLDLDKCLVVESWRGGKNHSGKNMFAYSSDDKSWHGMFADNEGRIHVFEGKVASGSAEFSGSSRGPNGETYLNRIRVLRVASDKVEEVWEKSTDNGVSWTTVFRGEYSRRKHHPSGS